MQHNWTIQEPSFATHMQLKLSLISTTNVLAGLGQMCYSDPINLEGFFICIMRNLAWEISWLQSAHQGRIPVYTIHVYKHLLTQTVMSFTAKTFFCFFCLFSPSLCSSCIHWVLLFSSSFMWLLDPFFSPILEKWWLCCTHGVSQLCKPTWLSFPVYTCRDIFVLYWSNLQKSNPNRRWFLECNSYLVWWGVNWNQTTGV